MKIVPLTKENEKLWNAFVDSNPNSTFFHTLEWKEIVEEVYGFKPMYFIAVGKESSGKDSVKGICPAFFTDSILFGKKIISTPFNFYNGPLFDDEKAGEELICNLKEEGRKTGSKYVEFKFMDEIDSLAKKTKLKKNDHYFISSLKLEESYGKAQEKYRKNHRKNLRTLWRNAEKDGLMIEEAKTRDELDRFHDVMVRVLRDKHNMIPQPFRLFYILFEKLRPKKKIIVFLVKDKNRKNKIIAGMIVLFHKENAIYAWGASGQDYKRYSPSTLLVDNAIKYCISKGCKNLDFGVTSPLHEDLLYFKESWGCTHKKLPYYYFLITEKELPCLDYHTSFKTLRKPFRFVPVWLIKKMSPVITKQLA